MAAHVTREQPPYVPIIAASRTAAAAFVRPSRERADHVVHHPPAVAAVAEATA
ncbi:hypothetical protein [Virgisporangium ochraceum]|uniref:hypothetical protein n=1 Tax=Virgisporangium ochraceum TaxID=65505 RepID=UPI0019434C09|nr:hypothetical protein [Virgisporangium ochraceum]